MVWAIEIPIWVWIRSITLLSSYGPELPQMQYFFVDNTAASKAVFWHACNMVYSSVLDIPPAPSASKMKWGLVWPICEAGS